MGIGLPELLVILVVVVVIFGTSKLSGAGKSLGKSVREFKEELHANDDDKDTKE